MFLDYNDGLGTVLKQEFDIGFFYSFKFDQISIRHMQQKIKQETFTEIPAYSFRNKHLFQAGNLSEEVQQQIDKNKTVRPYLWTELHNFAKDQNMGVLVEVIEDGQGRDFNTQLLDTFHYKDFINKGIDISIKQDLINNLKKYEIQNILGQGSYGKVFEASVNQESAKENVALKQIENTTLKQLSQIIVESQFHLFFTNKNIPLLKLEDLFLQKSETGFMLNLAMIQGTCELSYPLIEKNKGLCFVDLYPIFKDILLGITYMNSNFLTHGDIKPGNILMIGNQYCLCDYGTGINLYYEAKENNNDFFQLGNWFCAGTPNYCDPLIKIEMEKESKNRNYEPAKVYFDLFKNDIYQAGITIFEIATGASVKGMNNQDYNSQISYIRIHKLNLPTLMKNIILHMIQPYYSQRISSYALYQAFVYMSESIINATQLSVLRSLDEGKQYFYDKVLKFDHRNQNWFLPITTSDFFGNVVDDFKVNEQYRKIKIQTQKDQSFFSGSQKPDYNLQNNQCQKLHKEEILILMPNFILCAYDQLVSNDESRIILKDCQFKQKIYYKSKGLGRFFGCCKQIFYKKQSKPISQKQNKQQQFNFLQVYCFSLIVKNSELKRLQFQHYRNNSHVELYNHNTNSWLHCKIQNVNKNMYGIQVGDNQVSNLPINTLKVRQCICLKCILCKSEGPKFGYQKVDAEEKHMLRFDSALYNACQLFNAYDADLKENEKQLRVYQYPCEDLKKNSYLKGISNIYTSGKGEKLKQLLKVGQIHLLRADSVAIEDAHLQAFQSGALKMLYLWYCDTSPDQLISLFKILSTVKLQRFFYWKSIDFGTPTQSFLDELKDSFGKFAKSQQELYYLYFLVMIKGHDQVNVMKQFSEVSSLINKFGYRFSRGNFTLRIGRDFIIFFINFKVDDDDKASVKKVAKTIRSNLNEYYNDWKCEYGKVSTIFNGLSISN